MLEHFKGDEAFVKKILDCRYQALNHQRMILTAFLNPHEQNIVYKVIGTQDLQFIVRVALKMLRIKDLLFVQIFMKFYQKILKL